MHRASLLLCTSAAACGWPAVYYLPPCHHANTSVISLRGALRHFHSRRSCLCRHHAVQTRSARRVGEQVVDRQESILVGHRETRTGGDERVHSVGIMLVRGEMQHPAHTHHHTCARVGVEDNLNAHVLVGMDDLNAHVLVWMYDPNAHVLVWGCISRHCFATHKQNVRYGDGAFCSLISLWNVLFDKDRHTASSDRIEKWKFEVSKME